MCRCRTSLIGGAKKGHGKISWPNPIEVLQQNRSHSCRAHQQPARQLMTLNVTSPPSVDALRKVYSITSSAMESTLGGISRPSVFAVLRLMTNSSLSGSRTGSSDGFSPLRMRPT